MNRTWKVHDAPGASWIPLQVSEPIANCIGAAWTVAMSGAVGESPVFEAVTVIGPDTVPIPMAPKLL